MYGLDYEPRTSKEKWLLRIVYWGTILLLPESIRVHNETIAAAAAATHATADHEMSQREPVVEVIFAREKATRKKAKARQCDSRPQSPSRQYTWPSHFELIRLFRHNFEMSDENRR